MLAESAERRARTDETLSRAEIRGELRDSLPVLTTGLVPAAILGLARLGDIPGLWAQFVAETYITVRLALTGFVIERIGGQRPSCRTFFIGVLLAAVGLTVSVLKAVLGSHRRTGSRHGYAGTMASKNGRRRKPQPEFRNVALSDALQTQDMAAVAFALRHGPTVVPLMRAGERDDPLDAGEVWTYRNPETGQVALLLFSDAAHKPETLPPAVALQDPAWLLRFLTAHREQLTTVFFDIAGPHALQATPDDLIEALTIRG